MDKVYIISRYRADDENQLEFNKKVARYFCKMVVEEGKVPVAPHLFYTQFLDDNNPKEREYGLELGLQELRHSKEFLLVVIDGVISEGMRGELEEISRIGMPGRIVSRTRKEIEDVIKDVFKDECRTA